MIFVVNHTKDFQFFQNQFDNQNSLAMKTILSSILVACLCIYVNGQNNARSGIYREWDEIRFSQPSGDFEYEVTEEVRHYAPQKGVTYYKLNMSREEAKELGKILAFSDGKDLYISSGGPKLASRLSFVRTETIGEYYFYEDIVATPIIINNMTYMSMSRGQKIMNKSTGRNYLLSARKLKSIIAEDEELLTSFKSEPGKNKKLKEYLERFYNAN